MSMRQIAGVIVIFAAFMAVSALDNGLGRTPQMGWNSWNKFACSVNEEVIRETADAIVSLGLDKLGYNYVNIDDCWSSGRDKDGRLIPDPQAFPNGIKELADYIHSIGLKIGIYSDAGLLTCAARPGSLFHETIDAQTWADWGIDYLKYDNCYNIFLPPKWRYPRMRDALNKTGRPIFYSLCEWGDDDPSVWAQTVGNSWRTTQDIESHWPSVMNIYEKQVPISSRGGPGGWNDPDMLEVGNGNLTYDESKSHFAIWALMKSPMILGNDIRDIDNETLSIIANPELIAVNQDALGVPATRVASNNGIDTWAGPVVDGLVVAVLNKNEETTSFTFELSSVGFLEKQAKLRDLHEHAEQIVEGRILLNIPSHGIKVYKITNNL